MRIFNMHIHACRCVCAQTPTHTHTHTHIHTHTHTHTHTYTHTHTHQTPTPTHTPHSCTILHYTLYFYLVSSVEAAIAAVNEAVEKEDAEGTLASLHNECLDLSEVFSDNAQYYLNELAKRKRGKVEVRVHTYVLCVCFLHCVCLHTILHTACTVLCMYVQHVCMCGTCVRMYVRRYVSRSSHVVT